jgi:hypothetical protein
VVRDARTDVTERFGRILVAATDPGKLATRHWRVAETAGSRLVRARQSPPGGVGGVAAIPPVACLSR